MGKKKGHRFNKKNTVVKDEELSDSSYQSTLQFTPNSSEGDNSGDNHADGNDMDSAADLNGNSNRDMGEDVNSDNLNTSSASNKDNLESTRLIHTAIIEKDNPFLQSNNLDITKNQKSKSLVNPNDVFIKENNESNLDNSTINGTNLKDEADKANQNDFQRNNDKNNNNSGNEYAETKCRNGSADKVQILEAKKVNEGQGRSFVQYIIKYNDLIVGRRYSDFENLRNILVRLFPISIIPPIPEKQTIKNYGKSITGKGSSNFNNTNNMNNNTNSIDLTLSIINGNLNSQNEKLIKHRITILTNFLNKLISDIEIMKTSIILDFLDPNNSNWNDFINSSATFSSLPKNVLNCNPLDPTNTTRIYASLPIPNSSTQFKYPDAITDNINNTDTVTTTTATNSNDDTTKGKTDSSTKNTDTNKYNNSNNRDDVIAALSSFKNIEIDHKRYLESINNIYKYNKRINRTHFDLMTDYRNINDALLNYCNKEHQNQEISEQFIYLFNLYDQSTNILEDFTNSIYYNVNEPLNEICLMSDSMKKLLKYHKLKYIQRELIRNSLNGKMEQLNNVELKNKKFKDIDKIIDDEISKSNKISFDRPSTSDNDNNNTASVNENGNSSSEIPNQTNIQKNGTNNNTNLSPTINTVPNITTHNTNSHSHGGGWLKKFNKLAAMVKDSVNYQEPDPRQLTITLRKEVAELEEILTICNDDLIYISNEIKNVQIERFATMRHDDLAQVLKNFAKYMKISAEKNLKLWKDLKENQN